MATSRPLLPAWPSPALQQALDAVLLRLGDWASDSSAYYALQIGRAHV